MPDLKYSSQEDSLAYGIRDVHRNEFLTDCYFIAEGGERIKCHQCMLVCSPILKSILNSLDFRVGGNAAALSIPDFHPDSIRKLLHFLYEGEVSLQKGSRTLIEFKELCNLLEINPPVNKYRSVDDEHVKEETEEFLETSPCPTITTPSNELEFEECPSIPCEFCSLHFQDRATYEVHVSECEIKTPLDSFKMPDNFDLPEEIIRSTGGPPSYAAEGSDSKKVKSDTSDSEGFEDILASSSSSPVVAAVAKESPGQIEKKKKSSSKLIDDLFGEDPTSSSIKNESKKPVSPKSERKSVVTPSSKKEASAKSVIDELNEKRKRTISKLKDTVVPSQLQHQYQSKPPLLPSRPKTPNNHSKWLVNDSESSSESDVIDEDIGDRKLFKKRSSKKKNESLKVKYEKARISTSESSDDDESSSDINEDSLLSRTPRTTEKIKRKVQRGNSSSSSSYFGSKRLRVSVQLDGKEPFIEYATYKLRLLCGSDEETEKEDGGGDSSSSDEFSSRLRRVRKKDPSSYEETKWDKLKLKRLERSKSVSEIKSIIESKVMSKQVVAAQSNKGVDLKRSISETTTSSSSSSSSSPHLKKPQYDTKISNRPNPYPSFNFNYGLSTENKLLGEKSKSEALLSLSKVSFKKKISPASPGSKAAAVDPPASSSSSNPSN